VLLLTREVPDSMAFLSDRFRWVLIDDGLDAWIEFLGRHGVRRGYYLNINPLAGHETCGCSRSGERLFFAAHESDWEVGFPVNFEVCEFAGALHLFGLPPWIIGERPSDGATFSVSYGFLAANLGFSWMACLDDFLQPR
jgi:hypothetical protein